MRAFSFITIAASALSFVAPSFGVPVEAAAVAAADAKVVRSLEPFALEARDKGCNDILADVKVDIQVKIDVLTGLTADTCTQDVLETTLGAIVDIIVDATVQITALAGTGCVVDVSVCAQLVADILIALFGALSFVLTIVADVQILLDVIVKVGLGDCLCGLINAILAIVDGLLVVLVPLVLSLVTVIVQLGLSVVGELLTIC